MENNTKVEQKLEVERDSCVWNLNILLPTAA